MTYPWQNAYLHNSSFWQLVVFFLVLLVARATVEDEDNCPTRLDPLVQLNGERVVVNEHNFPKHSGVYPPDDQDSGRYKNGPEYFILNRDKPILYVSNFLNETAGNELKDICVSNHRFTSSPIRGYGDDHSVTKSSIRTSESYTLVPASMYISNPKYHAMLKQVPMSSQVSTIAKEVNLSWDIATRASSLMGVNPEKVEALQLVRYTTPNSEYKLHHDHGGFYEKLTEHRPWSMLIFLNDVLDGGYTAFPRLDLEVIPRRGDAIIWSNIKGNDEVDPDMVHMGKPPGKEGIEKYAVNVWFGGESFSTRSNEWSKW